MRLRSLAAVVIMGMVATFIVAAPAGADGGRPFSASLSGSTEVPGPGDPDGFGTASLRINPGHRRVCFDIRVTNITLPATAAHIHQGAPGIAGPVVVTLAPPGSTGMSSGCVTTSKDIIKAIFRSPGNYYVNVHTGDFPNGAVRGQLGRGGGNDPDQGGSASDHFHARLSGSNEVPFPGDPDGRGEAIVAILPDTGEVCFIIVVRGILLPATAAHIHQGAPGVAGPVVVTLSPPGATGSSAGCVGGLSSSTLSSILANPSSYYVNVHTTDFPDGAVRGQLSGQGGSGQGCDDDDDDDVAHHDQDGCDD